MSAIRLTEARIKTLKPTRSTRDLRDAALRGFGIRILPSGRKRFFIHTQCDGRRIWKLIGDPGTMTLAEARDVGRTALAAIRKGQPVLASPDETLFEVVSEEVFCRYARHWKPSTIKVNRAYLRNQILPWFRGRQIADITRKDVQDWFMSLHATPVAADRSAPVLSVIMAQAEGPRSMAIVPKTAILAPASSAIGERAVNVSCLMSNFAALEIPSPCTKRTGPCPRQSSGCCS